ncbi:dockerin type I domain-containing protein [Stieleria sp. TO1_6]|uniref:dockerin type I domain-containing protein n=1 Tax=Stieleria tagensis TaxID=2956795 RepID=UPI00209B77B0|nr:dockerin type I domain-containing protein [Stieleria tagensis]MCO8122258.1 dockerin type I domain-containing protein [Stieleria tagensis]
MGIWHDLSKRCWRQAASSQRTSKRPSNRQRLRRPQLQPLESRRVLAATVSIDIESPAIVDEDPRERLVYTLSRDETDDVLAVQFQISGSATYQVDYLVDEADRDTIWLPDDPPLIGPVVGTATFLPGEATVQLIVTPLRDQLTERNEDIQVTVVASDTFGPVSGAASLIAARQDTQYYVVDAQSQLARVNVETGVVNVIGQLDVDQPIADIAFTEDGDLFAISSVRLYQVHLDDLSDGVIATTDLGEHDVIGANSLIDARNADFGSGDGDLFAVGSGALNLQWIDLETDDDDQIFLNNVTTVFDIEAGLQAAFFQSNYTSSGDLDYLSGDHLVLSASRAQDNFDSLIEIQTPGNGGIIRRAPKPAEDPDEFFQDIYGFAFDGNDSYAFADHTLLEVNFFNRDVSRVLDLTGRAYDVGLFHTATGTIQGDPAPQPVVFLNTAAVDPADLPQGPQPTSWLLQRSQLSEIVIQLGASITDVSTGDLQLINLGMSTGQTPTEILLREDQLTLGAGGIQLTISPDPGQLPNGRYQLELSTAITNGPAFTYSGDHVNRFFVLAGDWDGTGTVDLRDLETLAYWYGRSTTRAPGYLDLDDVSAISEGDLAVFENNFAQLVQLPGQSTSIHPDFIDTAELARARQTILNRLDVNGSGSVTPLDALQVINRLASGFESLTDWRFDPNRDDTISPRDALFVINALALESVNAASESTDAELRTSAVDAAISDFLSLKRQRDYGSPEEYAEMEY